MKEQPVIATPKTGYDAEAIKRRMKMMADKKAMSAGSKLRPSSTTATGTAQ